jgi:hypothetical protein
MNMDAERLNAPYTSPENIERLLEKVRRNGLPPALNATYQTSIGIGEGLIPRNTATLRFLDLIESDSTPTRRLQDIVTASDEEWQALLQGALREAYPTIFQVVNPELDDRKKIFNAFRVMKPQSQWDRMTTLFLGLCRLAGMNVKEPPSDRPGKDGPKVRGPRKQRTGTVAAVSSAHQQMHSFLALPSGGDRKLDPALLGVVSKIAELETAEDLEAWITMFRAAFAFVKKVRLP